MALKIRGIHYDSIYLATYTDLEVFTEEIRNLLSTGYSLTLELFATNNIERCPQGSKYLPSFVRKQSDGRDTSGSSSSLITNNGGMLV